MQAGDIPAREPVEYHPAQHGPVAVRPATAEDLGVCIAIAASLPDFFTSQAVQQMRHDMQRFGALVGGLRRSVDGFLVACRKTPAVAEILWMAVRRPAQGKGIGSALLAETFSTLVAQGVRLVEVKTLAPGPDAPGYAATRRFYESQGFELLEAIDPYPGWDPGNPCAIYVKPLPSAD